MKRFIPIALSIIMLFTSLSPCLAYGQSESEFETHVDPDGAYAFTEEDYARQKEIDDMLRAQNDSKCFLDGLSRMIELTTNVTPCKQEKKYYCGPACTKMAFESLTGNYSHNQDWFADRLGTTDEGTYSGDIADFLRGKTGRNYMLVNMKRQTEEDFFNNISHSLDSGCPVIVNVHDIRGYHTDGHFLIIYGVKWDRAAGYKSAQYYYVDPHYSSDKFGSYRISNHDMYQAVNSGFGNYVRAL